MAIDGDDRYRLSDGGAEYGPGENRPLAVASGVGVGPVSYLFRLIGFAVPAIFAWLIIVLFARHTAISIALLIMVCSGFCGVIMVALTQSRRRHQAFHSRKLARD